MVYYMKFIITHPRSSNTFCKINFNNKVAIHGLQMANKWPINGQLNNTERFDLAWKH